MAAVHIYTTAFVALLARHGDFRRSGVVSALPVAYLNLQGAEVTEGAARRFQFDRSRALAACRTWQRGATHRSGPPQGRGPQALAAVELGGPERPTGAGHRKYAGRRP